jgi:hypothetical protein
MRDLRQTVRMSLMAHGSCDVIMRYLSVMYVYLLVRCPFVGVALAIASSYFSFTAVDR